MTATTGGRRSFASSLRQRISLAVVGITALVVAFNAAATWTISRALLYTSVDRELTQFAKRIEDDRGAHLPRQPGGGFPRGRGGPRGDGHLLIEVVDGGGTTLFRSSTLGDEQTLGLDGASVQPRSITLGDGRIIRHRSVVITALPPERKRPEGDGPGDKAAKPGPDSGERRPGPPEPPLGQPAPGPGKAPEPQLPITVHLGYDITRMTEDLHTNALVLGGMALGATLLAWGAVAILRTAILRPLHRLTSDLDRLGPGDLAARLPADAGPDEVRGLVSKLNSLLDRLHEAFTREQATIANIAHELRTPVAALRTDLEFRLYVATDPAERRMLNACMGTVSHMQTQVANLLLLARIESGRESLERSELDVADVVSDSIDRLRSLAREHHQTVEATLTESLLCVSSSVHLALLIDNLLGNAIAHGLPVRPVTVSLAGDGGGTTLLISNAYAGELNPESLGKPYYRGDGSRQDGAHCGLGLALCLRLSRLLGGNLTFATQDQVFVARLDLPPAR